MSNISLIDMIHFHSHSRSKLNLSALITMPSIFYLICFSLVNDILYNLFSDYFLINYLYGFKRCGTLPFKGVYASKGL